MERARIRPGKNNHFNQLKFNINAKIHQAEQDNGESMALGTSWGEPDEFEEDAVVVELE